MNSFYYHLTGIQAVCEQLRLEGITPDLAHVQQQMGGGTPQTIRDFLKEQQTTLTSEAPPTSVK